MGTRIHKKIGYGLTDVQHTDGRITDPRINTASPLLSPPDDLAQGYLAYLDERKAAEAAASGDGPSDGWFGVAMERELLALAMARGKALTDPVTWTDEGLPQVFLVQPMELPEWSRYDDVIDYLEECELYEPMEPRLVPVPRGLYPHAGRYFDSRTGMAVDPSMKRLIDGLLAVEEEGRGYADQLARSLGFDDADHARQHIAPAVPESIQRLCAWGELFTGPDTWFQLRPFLYVYWG